MPKVTFEVTPELKRLMEKYPEANWSGVLRRSIEGYARIFDLARQIEGELNDPRVRALAETVTRRAAARSERQRRARRR